MVCTKTDTIYGSVSLAHSDPISIPAFTCFALLKPCRCTLPLNRVSVVCSLPPTLLGCLSCLHLATKGNVLTALVSMAAAVIAVQACNLTDINPSSLLDVHEEMALHCTDLLATNMLDYAVQSPTITCTQQASTQTTMNVSHAHLVAPLLQQCVFLCEAA